jgi:putative redox protein
METRLEWMGGVAWCARSDSQHAITIDGAEKIGGANKGPRPMELVVKGLCGCAAMDIISILTKQKQQIEHATIHARASRTEDVPAVFKHIHLTFAFEGDTLKPQLLRRAVSLSMDKYCSVSKMLSATVEITYSLELNSVKLNFEGQI